MNSSRVLPTLAEFQAALQQYRRYQTVQGFTAIGICFCISMGLLVLDSKLYPWQEDKIGLATIICAINVCTMIWAGIRISRYEKKHLQLKCRICSKSLHLQSGIVLATGNCPHCGQRAIEIPDLPENDVVVPPRMTRVEFQRAHAEKSRVFNIYTLLGFVVSFAMMFCGSVTFYFLDGNHQAIAFRFLPALGFVFFVIPFLFWCRRRALRPRPYDELLNCPNCNTELGGSIVLATGKCQDCRRVVFTDSLDALESLKQS